MTGPVPKGMSWVPGGAFWMGSQDFYPEERPVHEAVVGGFWMDVHAVTVAQFRRFVKDTGHVTTAETPPDPAQYPGADPALLVPGSLVFTPTRGPVPLDDYRRWWSFTAGAQWRHPWGPDSTADGRQHHPVTHVSWFDARAYAQWAGKELPTEAEWEFAARGGLDQQPFVWGNEHYPKGRAAANTWRGRFPWENLGGDGQADTTPVGRYRSNGYGLDDMAGNVWEWTADYYTADHSRTEPAPTVASCCAPADPRIDTERAPVSGEPYPRRVIKGGSYLCAPNYCLRYRPAARQGDTEETSTCHIGFRCVIRA